MLSAATLPRQYRRKALSPVAATQAALDRIAARDGEVNAFRMVDAAAALASARQRNARKG